MRRPHRTTCNVLVHTIIDDWWQALGEDKLVESIKVIVDLSKAFDTVNYVHSIFYATTYCVASP